MEQQDKSKEQVEGDLTNSPLYYTRTRGLFRECYPGEKTDDPEKTNAPLGDIVELYMSPVETWCRNLDYYIPENDATKDLSGEEMQRIHMIRAMVALFIVGFFFMFVSFTVGVRGCWKTSPSNITASAILMLIACLFSAGGMGLWHGVEHWEQNKINKGSDTELFTKTWPKDLKDATNMQYLMPVYHQKSQQQYAAAAAAGPYGYAAYPGPYYGSQYGLQGPYSQGY